MSKWRAEARYVVRYLYAGLLNTAVGFGVIFFLTWMGAALLVANAVGYAVGMVFAFLLTKTLVFRSDGRWSGETLRYLLAFAIAFAANLAVLQIARHAVQPMWAQALAALTYSAVMFVQARVFVFRPT